LEADIEPFKGLLLGLFFISVGMSANLGVVVQRPWTVLGLALGLVAAKLALMFAVARLSGADVARSSRLGVALAQGGEFAFVLLGISASLAIVDAQTAQLLVLAVTASMIIAP